MHRAAVKVTLGAIGKTMPSVLTLMQCKTASTALSKLRCKEPLGIVDFGQGLARNLPKPSANAADEMAVVADDKTGRTDSA